MAKPILIIHPKDSTTLFLNRIKWHLINRFKDSIHHFNIQSNPESHRQCLSFIKFLPSKKLIIFMGHGNSEKLYGAKGRSLGAYSNSLIDAENPDLTYQDDNFINLDNISVFSGKIVFCLACNSNGKLAKEAINKGALAFIGFGNIPTSIDELREEGEKDGKYSLISIVRELKTEINYIIKRSLEIALANNYTVEELGEIMRFISNQRVTSILIDQKKLKTRKIISNYLYRFKKDIVILGDKKQVLLSE